MRNAGRTVVAGAAALAVAAGAAVVANAATPTGELHAAVAEGVITHEQAEALDAELARRRGAPPAPGPDPPHDGDEWFVVLDAQAATAYLGSHEPDLLDALFAGRSLADVARERGKSVKGLGDVLVAAATERLEADVDAGALTDEQRDEIVANLREGIARFVNRERPLLAPAVPGRRR